MRGRAYHMDGRVKQLAPSNGELVHAEVKGESTYTVKIHRQGRHAFAECSCEGFAEGVYCKHIWATLLAVQHDEGETPGASADKLSGLHVRAPKARKRDEAQKPIESPREPDWVGRLSLLRPPTFEQEEVTTDLLPAQRQVCYVVLPQMSVRHGGLIVELRQRSPIATGWSKLKPLKIGRDMLGTFVDPVDRQLCALILGSRRIDPNYSGDAYGVERGHACFFLPLGARRNLLGQMIDTQRCFMDPDEDSPGQETLLRWDGTEPDEWVLWMIAARTEDEMLIHVELRRGEKMLAIDQPQLILGGADGLVFHQGRVAAFDDRDAFRWVTQFREDLRRHGEAKSVRVPLVDVDRFLDRLYMLPQLPEIELPPGIGRQEHHARPVCHLDLFSAGSAQATRLLGNSPKQQLAAQLWFDYGGERVSPLQLGRFVTLGAAGGATDAAIEAATDAEAKTKTTTEDVHAPATMETSQVVAEQISSAEETVETSVESAPAADVEPIATDTEARLIRRDQRLEREAFAQLAAAGLRPATGATGDIMLLSVRQMPAAVSQLIGQKWSVSADERTIRRAGAPNLSITSGIDWFELRGGVRFLRDDGTEEEISLPRILKAARSGATMITLGDGSQALLPETWLEQHGMLTSLANVEDDHLRFRSSQAAMLDALLDDNELDTVDEKFIEARRRLHEFEGIAEIEPPETFKGELRPYQKEGLGWFEFLRWFGMGGVLADDMGLGKTVQVLAMFLDRYQNGAADNPQKRPSLVIAPKSVVFNWIDEAEHFAPSLRVVAYAGADRAMLRESFNQYDMIVTSYGLMRRDIDELRDIEFDYVALDEAQAIKNPTSQSAKAARLLNARHRLAITGTPVENHLGDLWSIFEFLNYGMLGASGRFNDLIRTTAAQDGATREQAIKQIATSLRPFILRRTKKQVLHDLPEKTEQTIVCEMEPAQRKIYDDMRRYYRGHLLKQLDATAETESPLPGRNTFMVLEALLRLRQIACHPGLVDERFNDEPSAKLDMLMENLDEIIDEGHKALVFSQFTSMLALVRKRLEARGIPYCYLDGQTRDRKQVVEQFQTDPKSPVFLISLKAGGFGLNLTAAEYVFILDPWWNPAVEQQAIDRAHRIGQTHRVFAYRLICQDTVEHRIIELQNHKRKLADAIVGGGEENLLRSLTRNDLEQLLS